MELLNNITSDDILNDIERIARQLGVSKKVLLHEFLGLLEAVMADSKEKLIYRPSNTDITHWLKIIRHSDFWNKDRVIEEIITVLER